MINNGVSSPEWFDAQPEEPFGAVSDFEPEGFTEYDAQIVVSVYVCATCEGELQIVHMEGIPEKLVVCPEHGNVERIGRISKTTVAIRNEHAVFDFHRVIRNLSEYWGELIPTKADRERTLKELGY